MAGDKSSGWDRDIVATYDRVAEEYASHFFNELANKSFDCNLLDKFSQLTPEGGRVCDMGCGPGHVARFLSERGVDVLGIDVSPAMIQVARRLNPGLAFAQGDMLHLQFPDNAFGGVAAFYSLIHIERPRVPQALSELHRVLASGGRLLASFHVGEGEVHRDEFLGQAVSFHATFFGVAEMADGMAAAGFVVEETLSRDPYDFEYPSQRAYLLARRP